MKEQKYREIFTKHEIFIRDIADGGDAVYVCRGCGCLVVDKFIHDLWHRGVGVKVVRTDDQADSGGSKG
jgi:hypothetical protein